MSKPVWSLSPGPACEAGKLIVQVIGKDHPPEQKVVLCTADHHVLKSQRETREKDLCSSVLQVWDCPQQAHHQLWLEVASTQGEPIRLPLLADPRITLRQADAQWNQLVPVLPFVSLPGSRSADDYGTPVLARAGFVYVFYQEKVWRELEVRLIDGNTTYHDVDIARYRQGAGFKTGERTATGVPLEDIWLPALWNNQPVHDLQLCFSEIQFNAARLQRLEQDPALRSQRCNSFQNLTCSNTGFKDLYTGKPDGMAMLEAFSRFDVHNYANSTDATHATVAKRNLEGRCFPVSVAAPQRAREPGFEWMLDHPGRYLCDLSGQFPVTASQEANLFLQACAKGTAENNDPVKHTELLELSAVADALQASMPVAAPPPDSTPEPNDEETDPWQAQASAVDVLSKARKRQICGVLLEDPRYRLRHLKSRLDTHHDLLTLCAQRAMQHPDHASALLIQQLVVPRELQGKPNPLHPSLEKLDDQGKQAINRCTAVLERATVWQRMNAAQNLLTASLQLACTQQALADHLSLEGFDYVAALFVISQTIASLAAPPSRLDPLAPSGDVVDAVSGVSLYSPQATPGQQWLGALVNNTDMPLHPMLWPECDMERACKPYQPPAEPIQNQGDGHLRATELAKFENTAAPAAAQQTTLDATIVANVLAGGSLTSFLITHAKNISGALMGIYDTLQGAVNTAVAAIDTQRAQLDQAETAAQASHAEHAGANDRLARTKALLGARVRTVSVKLHAQGVEQLRSLMPNTFGPAYFMRRGQVTQDYYLFGLEDLPSRQSVPQTFYGEFLNERGDRIVNGYRNPMPDREVTPAEHLVLVIPRNHSTAQLVSNMNKQLTAAQQTVADVKAADDQVGQARTALGSAMEQHNARSNATAFRILNSRPFAVGVLMIEMWNVDAEMQSKEQNLREKGKVRTSGGVWGSYIDLVIAMEALTVKLVGTQSALAAARKPLFEISKKGAEKWLGETLAARVNKIITTRLIAQSVSGIVFAGLSLYDTWYAWQWNDSAMYGYLLMTGGATAGVAAGLIIATPVLGLTPLGWLALLLVGTGAGLVLWLSNSPLEEWLANGPFASTSNAVAEHLQDPEEAFYRLVGLLAGISITVKRNPLFEPNAKLDRYEVTPLQVRTANTLIRIESRLPGLLGVTGNLGIQADCRMRELVTVTSVSGIPVTTRKGVSDLPVIPEGQRLYSEALELYVKTPAVWVTPAHSRHFEWEVRAQFILKTPSKTHYFPAPAIKDPTRFGPEYAKANFNMINRPFWADEQTHKAP